MKKEQIIQWARDSGLITEKYQEKAGDFGNLSKFAEFVRSATKEEDAKICDEMAEREDANFQQEFALDLAAQAIRESKP